MRNEQQSLTMNPLVPANGLQVLYALNKEGFEAHFVGGCVRDMLRNVAPHDWDICTNATPDEMKRVFARFNVIETGIKHGTLTVVLGSDSFEVTTYRTDGIYTDGRHPDNVTFTKNLEEDLARRDFTMNAIAIGEDGTLFDPFNGVSDIKRNIIRCVGNAKDRFSEDKLRILRALRFSAVIGYSIAPETAEAIHESCGGMAAQLSAERISAELLKLIQGRSSVKVMLQFSDVMKEIIPELGRCMGFKQNNPNHIYDVWQHTMMAIRNASNNKYVRLAILFHDIGKPLCYQEDGNGVGHFPGHGKFSEEIAADVLTRLRLDTKTVKCVTLLVKNHDRVIEERKPAVRKLLNQIGGEQFELLMQVREADVLAQSLRRAQERLDKVDHLRTLRAEIEQEDDCLSIKDLAVNGNDLVRLGYKGPSIGKKLQELLLAVLEDPEQNTQEKLLQLC